jgi:hypothetical protein
MKTKYTALITTGLLCVGLVGCGDDDGGAFISPPVSSPSVFVFNPPTTLFFGESVLLDVEVRTPAGARSFDYLEIESTNPFGETTFFSLAASEFGSCFSGATFCASDDTIGFEIPAFGPGGTWTLTIRAFDQDNRSGSETLFFNAVGFN